MEFSYKLWGFDINDGDVLKKQKVYFCCHPDDFEAYFDIISSDIFKSQKCAIFFKSDANSKWNKNELKLGLGSMRLFIVVATQKFLQTPSVARDEELKYAFDNNIPVLPLVIDGGFDELYNDIFGERHYILKDAQAKNKKDYEEKLEERLNDVLVPDELVNQIREAFDSYAFLSYRKRDKAYADNLLHFFKYLISRQDIGIWYDGFLTPGEKFTDEIGNAIKNSKFFVMLVTPSLLKKDNYVMQVEYPEAVRQNKVIIPICICGMTRLQKKRMSRLYKNIPEILEIKFDRTYNNIFLNFKFLLQAVHGFFLMIGFLFNCGICSNLAEKIEDKYLDFYYNVDEFLASLEDVKQKIQKIFASNNITFDVKGYSNTHKNYLRGLAYLGGIYTAQNTNWALFLLKISAKADYIPAIEKLSQIYSNGIGVSVDYNKSVFWQEKLVDILEQNLKDTDKNFLNAKGRLAELYRKNKDIKKATIIDKEVVTALNQNSSDDQLAIKANINLSVDLRQSNQLTESIEILEQSYINAIKEFGESHISTLNCMKELAMSYVNNKDYEKAQILGEKVLELCFKVLGKLDVGTFDSIRVLCHIYYYSKQYNKAIQLAQYGLELCQQTSDRDFETLKFNECIFYSYKAVNQPKKAFEFARNAFEFARNAFELTQKVNGEEYKGILKLLENLYICYTENKEFRDAESIAYKGIDLSQKFFGEQDINTLKWKYYYYLCAKRNSWSDEVKYTSEAIEWCKKTLGASHEKTIKIIDDAVSHCVRRNNYQKAIAYQIDKIKCYKNEFGIKDSKTIDFMFELADIYKESGDTDNEILLLSKILKQCRETFGNADEKTIKTMNTIADFYIRNQMDDKALCIYKEILKEKIKPFGKSDLIKIPKKFCDQPKFLKKKKFESANRYNDTMIRMGGYHIYLKGEQTEIGDFAAKYAQTCYKIGLEQNNDYMTLKAYRFCKILQNIVFEENAFLYLKKLIYEVLDEKD